MGITEQNERESQAECLAKIFVLGACQGFVPGVCTAAAVLLLSGCANVERWAQTHEREYRAEYRDGGGAVSVTVRPVRDGRDARDRDGKGVVR